ncbi:MAG: acetyl-CoA C-acetyltransferase, partial [Pirellulaceae bacterium]
MRTAWLIGGRRTPIGRYLGDLSSLSATHLAGRAIAATVERSGIDPKDLGEIIMGQVLSA